MWAEALSYLLSACALVFQAVLPCNTPELLPANTIDQQQYLGKWFFKAAVSHSEPHIQTFRTPDNIWFQMDKTANDTLLLTGHMRIGDNCGKQTWTYFIHPDRDDLELKGRAKRRTLIWSGKWANCRECIILQEIEPPLSPTDSEDSLGRFMLYARQSEAPDAVRTFLKNAACEGMTASVRPRQEKEFCA